MEVPIESGPMKRCRTRVVLLCKQRRWNEGKKVFEDVYVTICTGHVENVVSVVIPCIGKRGCAVFGDEILYVLEVTVSTR